MFSGRHDPGPKDKEGRYFFDRPPEPFRAILNALRTDTVLKFPEAEEERTAWIKEIRYYEMSDYFGRFVHQPDFPKSTLLSTSHVAQLNEWIGGEAPWTLAYVGTRDGFESIKFHEKCDGRGESVVVIKSTTGSIFGGYTPCNWGGSSNYVFDQRTFLFTLESPSGKPRKFSNTGSQHSNTYSIYANSGYGPTFGGGHDLYVVSQCDKHTSSYTNLGHSFEIRDENGTDLYSSQTAKEHMAGSYNFQVAEMEVFVRKSIKMGIKI
jgi:hypothetical protein